MNNVEKILAQLNDRATRLKLGRHVFKLNQEIEEELEYYAGDGIATESWCEAKVLNFCKSYYQIQLDGLKLHPIMKEDWNWLWLGFLGLHFAGLAPQIVVFLMLTVSLSLYLGICQLSKKNEELRSLVLYIELCLLAK